MSTEPSANSLAEFYSNKNVLITGATGFVGKVLLWKLLTEFKDIGTIFVLMREKNGDRVQDRLSKLLNQAPFAGNFDYGKLLNQVKPIKSDMTSVNCGISISDKQTLQQKVNIAFHSAASVKFDAPLNDNMKDNVYATQNMLNLCADLPKLLAFVHVSTAYSNCHITRVSEELIPLGKPVDQIIEDIEKLSPEQLANPPKSVLAGRPNTYTYTKAIAEQLVARYEGKFPITIVRPSIVISASAEPTRGWVDNYNGICGLGSLAAVGLLRTVDWDYYATSDMVPVDYVVNCLICAAQYTHLHSSKKLTVFNMTSGNSKPVSWGDFFKLLRNHAIANPPGLIVRPLINPPQYKRVNKLQFILINIFSELLFAYFVDFILMLLGQKKILVKITKKMHHGYKILKPFTIREWVFENDNIYKLLGSLNEDDKQTFMFDMKNLDWDEQAESLYFGSRKFLFKEKMDERCNASARSRRKVVTVAHYILTSLFAMIVITLFYASVRVASIPIQQIL